jgi:competence protein ComEA
MIRRFITQAAFVATSLFAGVALAATDVNRATLAELESVKGIGPGLASKIMKAREAGTFSGWPDLVERVAGVGPGNAMRFSQAGLTVGGAPYAQEPAGTQTPGTAKSKAEKTEKAGKAERAVSDPSAKAKADRKTPSPADTKASRAPATAPEA